MRNKKYMKIILVALGGNAIKQANEKGTTEEQFKNCRLTCKHLAEFVNTLGQEDRLIITHGNGPQAGNLLVQQEENKDIIPSQSMDIVGAMTQGQIGYMLQQSLTNYLKDLKIEIPVISIVNQVLVDKKDPEFSGDIASKPVGNFFTEKEAMQIKKDHPEYIFKKVKPGSGRVWRRTVPSPLPLKNIETEAIRRIVDSRIIVIASGGGGIPVINNEKGHYTGVEAVIDKDLAGEKLAEIVNANILLILTDVDNVKLNFGKPNEKSLEKITLSEAKKYLKEGHFLAGSMGPKIMACINFLEHGGDRAVITSLNKIVEALERKAGTQILRD